MIDLTPQSDDYFCDEVANNQISTSLGTMPPDIEAELVEYEQALEDGLDYELTDIALYYVLQL